VKQTLVTLSILSVFTLAGCGGSGSSNSESTRPETGTPTLAMKFALQGINLNGADTLTIESKTEPNDVRTFNTGYSDGAKVNILFNLQADDPNNIDPSYLTCLDSGIEKPEPVILNHKPIDNEFAFYVVDHVVAQNQNCTYETAVHNYIAKNDGSLVYPVELEINGDFTVIPSSVEGYNTSGHPIIVSGWQEYSTAYSIMLPENGETNLTLKKITDYCVDPSSWNGNMFRSLYDGKTLLTDGKCAGYDVWKSVIREIDSNNYKNVHSTQVNEAVVGEPFIASNGDYYVFERIFNNHDGSHLLKINKATGDTEMFKMGVGANMFYPLNSIVGVTGNLIIDDGGFVYDYVQNQPVKSASEYLFEQGVIDSIQYNSANTILVQNGYALGGVSASGNTQEISKGIYRHDLTTGKLDWFAFDRTNYAFCGIQKESVSKDTATFCMKDGSKNEHYMQHNFVTGQTVTLLVVEADKIEDTSIIVKPL
jgi:hypothetical protein